MQKLSSQIGAFLNSSGTTIKMPSDNSLHKAAHKGDLDECKKYVEGDGTEGEELIGINEPGASDRRALHRSAGAGHLQLCVYFIEKAAEIDLVSFSSTTQICILPKLCDSSEQYKSSLRITNPFPFLQADKSGRTALHWAAISGHTEIVRLLLEKGANIQAETGSKMNALHGAVEGGRIDTVRALMEFVQGKDELKLALTTAKNGDDKTAWDISAASKNRAMCQILKDFGDSNGASSSCSIC